MGFFGPSKDEVWSELAKEIGGDLKEGGLSHGDLCLRSGEWEIVLDNCIDDHPDATTTYTRMRVPFINKNAFRFKLYREGFISTIERLFGMQDIVVGDSSFDSRFIIQSNSEAKVKEFLDDGTLKDLIKQQPKISFEIIAGKDFSSQKLPESVDVLYFYREGVMKDLSELKSLFELFAVTLERLVEIGVACSSDPKIRLS